MIQDTSQLDQAKIDQLISAIGTVPADHEQLDATDYNWHQPHYYNTEQLSKLADFTEKAAILISQKFTELYHSDYETSIVATTQHFGEELVDASLKQQDHYYILIGTDKAENIGYMQFPPETALLWTTQMLGDTSTEESEKRELSQLEKSLIGDIATALIEAVSDTNSNITLHTCGSVIKGQLPIEFHGTEQLCRITFRASRFESSVKAQAHIIMPCEELEPAIGKKMDDENQFPKQMVTQAILDHLNDMKIYLTATLAETSLKFHQAVQLEENDILMLDKNITEPLDITVENLDMFKGYPAKSGGKFAAYITDFNADLHF